MHLKVDELEGTTGDSGLSFMDEDVKLMLMWSPGKFFLYLCVYVWTTAIHWTMTKSKLDALVICCQKKSL